MQNYLNIHQFMGDIRCNTGEMFISNQFAFYFFCFIGTYLQLKTNVCVKYTQGEKK